MKSVFAMIPAFTFVASADAQDAPRNALEEVIVTAQKREESVRDVPLAINAFSAVALEKANVTQMFDLPRLAPSLVVDTGARADKPRFVIRGVGSSGGTAIEPSVATFVDGVYIPREGATLSSYFDLQAIEVLRGPQGTLFGRNASVGAINLRTAVPTDDTGGKLTATIGNGERYTLDGHFNVALSDNFAVRVAALGESFGGLYENDLTGDDVGGVDTGAIRLSARARFSEQWEDVLRIGYSQRQGNDYFTHYALMPDSFPTDAGRDVYLSRFAAIGSDAVDLDPFDTHINQFVDDELDEKRNTVISNQLTYELSNGAEIRLISGYNEWELAQRGHHVFGAETPTLIQFQYTRSESTSHELQFISPENFLIDRLTAVAGLYYFNEDLVIEENFQFAADLCTLALSTNPNYASCLANAGNLATNADFSQTTDSLAAYTQLTYGILDNLDLTLGVRWSQDDKEAFFTQGAFHPVGALLTATETTPLELDGSRVTYRANLSWHPTDDALLFASFTTGFKSGGFNSASSNVAFGQARVLRPETVESYEVGAKTSWLDDALTLDVTAYQMDIEDFQDRSFTGLGFAIRNAGGIRNRGVETEFALRPLDWLRLSGGVAWLDSEFTSYPGASNLPGIAGTQDLRGTRPTFTPEWAGNFAVELDGDVGLNDLTWTLRTDLSLTSESNIGGVNDNNPDTMQDGYALLGVRASISGPTDRWTLALFGRNLTDEGYCTSFAYQPFAGLLGAQIPGHAALRCNVVAVPRTFGASFSISF